MSSAVMQRGPRTGEMAPPSVLLVDDRPANLLALEAILAPLGLDLVRAESGEQALRHLLKKDFAVVLLDVQMPGMDGFETASAIKSHPRTAELPILFVPAISREAGHVFEGYARGAVDYILKPFEPNILRAKVSVFVELYSKNEIIKAQAKMLHAQELEKVEQRGESRLRVLTESMPLIMLALRHTGSVYYVNRAWTEYSGLTAESTAGIDNPAFLHPEDAEGVHAKWTEAMTTRTSFDVECRLRRGDDGAYRWHLVRAVPERKYSVIEGWVVTATDINEQKDLQRAQGRLLESEQRARQAAEATNRMKDEFLANVSHELRTPLNAILGWTHMLRSGMLDPPRVAHALETIERNAHMQTDLIEDLLDVSRIISGQLRIKTVRVDIGAVGRAAVETVRPAADLKGVALECIAGEDIEEINGDPDRLQQIVSNLVENAVKFTAKGGRVEVRVARADSMMEIIVSDCGAGISADFLPFVFDRFRQADNSSTRLHQGLGLGLAIVRHLVKLHGGHVRAESAGLGMGSTFTVTLPMRLVHTSDPEPGWFVDGEPDQLETKRLEGFTVLFVDDNADALELFKEFLEHEGAHVVVADSAASALDAVKLGVPHVMVSDIGLPGEDGYALIRSVRNIAPSLPAIAVSGYARMEDRKRALAEGFQMHLAKPVDLTELVRLIASLAEAHVAAR